MCLMITKPSAAKIKKEYLEDAFKRNGDGAGIAVARGGRVTVIRPFWKFEHFWKAYQNLEQYPLLIHFRLATHGSKCEANTHPHPITRDLAMAHNGQIVKVKCEGDESDTVAFLRLHVNPALKEGGQRAVVSDESLKKYDGEIGASKLAFMNSLGHFWYVNKQMGHEHEGCWYSNYTYKQNRPFVTTTDTNYSNHSWHYNSNWKLDMVYCPGCRCGHQNRNTNSFYLDLQALRDLDLPARKYGISVNVCRKCLEGDGHEFQASGHQKYGDKPGKALVASLKLYFGMLEDEDLEAKTAMPVAGSRAWGTKSCCACGLLLPERCNQPFYDPTSTFKEVLHMCRLCIGSLDIKTYWPDQKQSVAVDGPEWSLVTKCRMQARQAYEEANIIKVRPSNPDDTVFPPWIEATGNLLTPEPKPKKETVIPYTSNALTLVHGWCCEMCGEAKLTGKRVTGERLCTLCAEDYIDSNFDWDRASLVMAKRLGVSLPTKKGEVLA